MKRPFDAESVLSEVDWRSLTRQLSDALVDQAFFLKDKQGRFLMQNRRGCEYCKVAQESETLGKTDADYWSQERTASYLEGDQLVMRLGQPIINQLAPAPEESGSANLVLYSKFPVRDQEGNIIGVAGVHQEFEAAKANRSPFGKLFQAIRRIQEDFGTDLKITELASLCQLSHSQFVRRFQAALQMTPKEYLLRVRVRNACRLLESTGKTVSEIALDCGFYDHSHFSRAFRKQAGVSPSQYRNEHRGSYQAASSSGSVAE
ncbi:MAG: helix-turn-helix domain-containing protein [Verrucomicrobiota bacterium]